MGNFEFHSIEFFIFLGKVDRSIDLFLFFFFLDFRMEREWEVCDRVLHNLYENNFFLSLTHFHSSSFKFLK